MRKRKERAKHAYCEPQSFLTPSPAAQLLCLQRRQLGPVPKAVPHVCVMVMPSQVPTIRPQEMGRRARVYREAVTGH